MIKQFFKNVPKEILDKTYIVGGIVRDIMYSKINNIVLNFNDIDYVVCNSSEQELLNLGFKKVAKDFPVFLKNGCEFALARTEKSTGDKYTDYIVSTNNVILEEDLSRRDLSINMMAIDYDGNLIDPYNGFNDLKNGILRHRFNTFMEDPLRMLRLARFSAKYPDFTMAKETIQLCKDNSNKIKEISNTRIFLEVQKVMGYENPVIFFKSLEQLDLLKAIPYLNEMNSLKHNKNNHAEGNVFKHSILVLEEVSKLTKHIPTRFAALYHDIGKVHTYNEKSLTFYGHDDKDLCKNIVNELALNFSLSKEIKEYIFKAATTHHKFHNFYELRPKTILDLVNSFKRNEFFLEEILKVVEADSVGRWYKKDDKIIKGEFNNTIKKDLINILKILNKQYNYKDVNREQIIQHKINLIKGVLHA